MKPNEIVGSIGIRVKGLEPREWSIRESVWGFCQGFCGPRVQSLPESGARGKDLDIEDRWIDSLLRFNKALLSYYILRRLLDCDIIAVAQALCLFVAVYSLGAAPLGDA